MVSFKKTLRHNIKSCAQISSQFSSAVIYTRWMHLANLTLTKMQPTSAEKPRVRIGVVSVSMVLKRESYFIGHTWSPYFSETLGGPYVYECFQILQSKNIEVKTFYQKSAEERVARNPRKVKILHKVEEW